MNLREVDRNPVPLVKVTTLGLVQSVNSMSIYAISAFLPFMIEFFYPGLDVRDVGGKAGMIGSAFSIGAVFGNFLWSYVADRCGRRIALLSGLMGSCISVVLFAVAPTFEIALFIRFLWGILNSTVVVAKVYLGETLDDSNQLRGTAYYGIVGGIGRVIGPFIGGFLSPTQDSLMEDSRHGTFFGLHPFAVPCVFILLYSGSAALLAFFFLPETKQFGVLEMNADDELESDRLGSESNEVFGPTSVDNVETEATFSKTSISGGENQSPRRKVEFLNKVMVKKIGSDSIAFGSLNSESPRSWDNGNAGHASQSCDYFDREIFHECIRLMTQRETAVVVLVDGLFSLMQVAFIEIFPLWAITKREDGGADFSAQNIGLASMIAGPVIILSMFLVYPRFAEAQGPLKTLRTSLLVFMLCAAIFPSAPFAPWATNASVTFLYVALLSTVMSVADQWILITTITLMNNLATSSEIALLNALGNSSIKIQTSLDLFSGQTSVLLGRCIGPYAGAEFFMWTERNGLSWPLNHALTWYILAILAFLLLKLSRLLPLSAERKKVNNDFDQTSTPSQEQTEPLLHRGRHRGN